MEYKEQKKVFLYWKLAHFYLTCRRHVNFSLSNVAKIVKILHHKIPETK